jgi:carboxymethylenebutenolidase
MPENIQLRAGDGHELGAYLHRAPGARAGLVILQEIFGVNHHIRSVVDRFAGEGFTSIAPALFDRTRRGVELGYDGSQFEEGRKLAASVTPEQVVMDIDAAIDFLRSEGMERVGVVGYCFGGTFAWLSATRLRPEVAVGYYGARVPTFAAETPHCPVMLHFGAKDQHIPAGEIDKIRVAHPEIPIYLYDAGHGFSCDERESFAPEASALAFSRTLAFLKEHLLRQEAPPTSAAPA